MSLAVMTMALASNVDAQSLTADPAAWRSFAYTDLQNPSSTTATFADIWRDAIEENNRKYLARGDKRYAGGNAPAREAHFIIWSPAKSVVLSVLDTAAGCTPFATDQALGAIVKLCPVRITQYEGATVKTSGGGKLCFLERPSLDAAPESSRAAAYASYDIATKTIRTGLMLDHKPLDGCSISIPLHRQEG
jgi:hypothetical protein